MAAVGARGKTAEQMRQVLHLPADPIAPAFAALLRRLQEGDATKRGFTLTIANALWAQQGYPWRPEYKKLIQQQFQAGLFDVDFISQSEVARTTINAWVKRQTGDKIEELLPRGSITPHTRTVLTNAIYFRGTWLTQFDKQQTREQDFTRLDGSKTRVPLMFQEISACWYAERSGIQALELPYAGQRLSLLVLLPQRPEGLLALEQDWNHMQLQTLLQSLRAVGVVRVHLPRFRIEATYDLKPPLSRLGMRLAFSDQMADFSGMHTGPEPLYISDVVHKSLVEVDEQGTQATAATGVVIKSEGSIPKPPQTVPVFRADRPFLFFIRDRGTGSLLFMGRLVDPTAQQR